MLILTIKSTISVASNSLGGNTITNVVNKEYTIEATDPHRKSEIPDVDRIQNIGNLSDGQYRLYLAQYGSQSDRVSYIPKPYSGEVVNAQ